MKRMFKLISCLMIILMFTGCASIKEKVKEELNSSDEIKTEEKSETTIEEEIAMQEEAVDEEEAPVQEEKTVVNDNEIRPEFQKAMDEYKGFFEEYCAFMKKYSESDNPATMLVDYGIYMTKFTSTMSAFEKIEDEEMTSAEMNLYLQTLNEINDMLLKAIQ